MADDGGGVGSLGSKTNPSDKCLHDGERQEEEMEERKDPSRGHGVTG